jgi:hypothetical protein
VASIKAQIDILLTGQRNISNLLGQLNEIEGAIAQIESKWKVASAALQRADIRLGATGRQQPRGEGGRFASDPDRRARVAALADRRRAAVEQRLARMGLSMASRQEASIRDQIEGNERILRQTERRITFQERLNSAVQLFETRQQKLARGGGGRGLSQGLRERAREIQAAFEAAGGGASRNLSSINSLATGLGRVVERQNEFNRLQALGSKGFEAGRRLQERIDVVAQRGVVPSRRIDRLRGGAARVIATSNSGDQQAYSEAVRAATAAISRVERESRKLAGDLARNATRSPIRGGTGFPGSPKAVEAQQRAQELALRQSQKGYPASPILGTAAMAGSPRAMQAQERSRAAADRALRAQERAAKVAETAADKALKESQKGFPSSPLLGAAGMAGSPKALQAQERNRAAVERRIATQRRAEERAAKLQQQAAAAAERAADRALKEAQEGYPSSPVLGGASMSGSPRWKTAQESAKRKVEAAARATERAADKAIAEAQKGYPASPILGSATMAGSPRALQAQERSRMAADRALRAQAKVAKAAESAADKALSEAQKGYPASPILGTATMAGSPRAAQAQERSRAAAERALRAQERVAKAAETAADRALKQAQQGYPTSPVSGSATTPGSPKALQAQQRAQAAADRALRAQARAAKVAETAADKALAQAQKGFPSSPILGTAAMAGSPRAMQAQERARAAADRVLLSQERAAKAAQSAADKALADAQKGYPSSPVLGTATTTGSPRWKVAQQAAERKLEAAAKAMGAAADKALAEAQKGYPASPILGTATMAGSPRWKAAQERLASKAGGTKASALPGAGLQAALQSLQEARNSRQQFLGTMSPAEGIDKIVREFNTGKPVAQNLTSTFAQDIQSGSGAMAKAATSAFTAVKSAIEKVWKIKSPSGVMIEIVKNIVSTFVTEILAAGPSVRSAIEDTFNSKSIDRDYGDIGTRNPRAPSPTFGLDPNVALRLGGGRVTGGYPPVSGIFAPGSTPPIGGSGSGYPFFPPYQMTGTKLPTPGMKGAQFPVDPMVDLRQNRSEDTSKVVVDRIKQFRADVANFWEGTDSQFEAVSRVLKSSIQLSAARFARRLQQSKVLTPDQEFEQVANEAKSLLPAGGSSQLSGVVARAKQGVERLSEFFKRIGDFVSPDYDDQQITRKIFAEGGPSYGKTFVSGQGEDRYKLGYSEGMLGIPDDLQDIPLEGGNKIRNAVESFYDKIVKSLGGLGGPGGPRPPAGGGAGGGFYSDPGDLARRATEAAQQGPEALLGLKELAAPAKVSTKELEALSAILKEFRSVLDPTVEGFDQLNKRLRNTAGNIDRQLERRAPDADFLTRSVGPRAGRAVSEGLIGGAFPLLFGQGAGAAAGGLAGGAAGGFAGGGLGFGLSLIGTALGTAFDTAVQSATELGAALVDTSKTFDLVKDRSLFSSKETEKLATKLSEMGFAASASILAQQEIINKVGATGYRSLTDLASASDETARAWGEFNLQLQAALAGPMAGLLEWVTSILALQNQSARSQQFVKDVSGGLGGEVKQEFDREAKIISGREAQGSTIFGTLFGGISKEDATKQRNELAQAYADFAIPVKIEPKLTDKQKIEQELAMLGKGLEVLDAGKPLKDAIRQAAREQQDLDKQRADLVRSYEESIGNIRKQVEDEVSRRRFSILEKENQLLDLQGENRIKQLEAANAQTVALAGRGERSEVAGVAQEVAQIVAGFTEQQLSAEEEAAKIKRDAALDARKLDFEAGQFKANIEKEVARLNIETARQVAGINEGVRRRNEETDSRRFNIEKSIAILKMQQLQDELSVASFTNSGLTASDQKMMTEMYYGIDNNIKFLRQAKPPAKLQEVAQVGGAGVPTANFDAIVAREQGAIQALVDEALKGVDLAVKGSREALTQTLLNVTDNIDQSLKDVETREADAEVNRLRRIELVNAGLTESVAQRVMELEQLKKITLAQYDAVIAEVEGRIVKEAKTAAQLATNEALREEIKLIKERKDALEGKFGTFDATTGTGTGAIGSVTTSQRGNEIQEFITRTTAELNNLEQVAVNVSQNIGNAIGSSLANGIAGLIEGTTTAKEVFANFLKSIGQILVQEGTKMIAMYIAIAIAKAIAGMSGGVSGANSASALGTNPNVAAYSGTGIGDIGIGTFANANGNAFGANGIMPFAKGGAFTNSIVSSPTLFKFANGGTTQMGEMGEAGPEAIMPLSRGAGGRLGVDASGLREAMDRQQGGASGSPVLNMSFQSTSINGVEYVSREQLESAMAETRRNATRDGAKRGMTMTLDRIQNSSSTRRKVGI